MEQLWERFYPLLISVTVLGLSVILNLQPYIKGFEKVLDGTITFTSIVIGFLGALLAIILSISKTKVMQHLYNHIDKSNGKNLLYSYFRQSVLTGFIVVVSSISMYVFREMMTLPWYGKIIFYLWIFTTVYFILASYRIVNILMTTLFTESKYSGEENHSSNQMSNEEVSALKEKASKK